jgi:hypothetical protein
MEVSVFGVGISEFKTVCSRFGKAGDGGKREEDRRMKARRVERR